jgi:hypothetical protein
MASWRISSANEVAVLLLLLGAVALFGFFKYLKEVALLRGFSGITRDIRILCRLIHGERTRDGKDLVIRGRYAGSPVLIRLSRTESVPELNIQIKAQARCNLFVAPIRARSTEGAARLHTTHALLNTRCSVRTDEVLEARALLQSRQVPEELWRLCCSSEAYLSLANGCLEFSEEQLPSPDTAGWIKRHLRSLAFIAATAQGTSVPPEEAVPSVWAQTPVWVAIASTALIVIGLFTFVSAKGSRNRVQAAAQPAKFVSDVPAAVASQIPDASSWRLAQPSDFDPHAADWAAQQHDEVTGSIAAKFTTDDSKDEAYVLINSKTSEKRVVILVNGVLRFDANLPELALAARIPAGNISNIEWKAKPTSPADGDGLLVLRRFDDSSSSIVIYYSGLRPLTAIPIDYHRVSLD